MVAVAALPNNDPVIDVIAAPLPLIIFENIVYLAIIYRKLYLRLRFQI